MKEEKVRKEYEERMQSVMKGWEEGVKEEECDVKECWNRFKTLNDALGSYQREMRSNILFSEKHVEEGGHLFTISISLFNIASLFRLRGSAKNGFPPLFTVKAILYPTRSQIFTIF